MRPDSIVMASPARDGDPGFLQCADELTVERLVTELRVEAFTIAVLPGAAWFDVSGLAPIAAIQSWTALAMNSGPLSEECSQEGRNSNVDARRARDGTVSATIDVSTYVIVPVTF